MWCCRGSLKNSSRSSPGADGRAFAAWTHGRRYRVQCGSFALAQIPASEKRRVAALKDPFFIELMESGKTSWSGVRKYLRAQDKAGKTTSGAIRNAVSELIDHGKELIREQTNKGTEKEEVERKEQKLSGIIKVIAEHAVPLLQAVDAGPSAEKTFEQAYSPEYLERLLKCGAALDSRIDKLLGRLVSLKEYKRVYGAHMLPSPTINSPATATELADLIS
jgi:hypothetical protein